MLGAPSRIGRPPSRTAWPISGRRAAYSGRPRSSSGVMPVRGRSIGRSRATRPGRGLSTTTRLPRKTASSTLWVTKTRRAPGLGADPPQVLLQPLAGQRVQRRERLVEQQQRVLARPAPGRSPRAAAGRRRSARCGGAPRRAGRPGPAARRPGAAWRAAGVAQGQLDVAADGLPREQPGLLEDQPGAAARHRRACRRCGPCRVVGCSKPAISRSRVLLPQPDAPTSTRNSPAGTVRSTGPTAVTSP